MCGASNARTCPVQNLRNTRTGQKDTNTTLNRQLIALFSPGWIILVNYAANLTWSRTHSVQDKGQKPIKTPDQSIILGNNVVE